MQEQPRPRRHRGRRRPQRRAGPTRGAAEPEPPRQAARPERARPERAPGDRAKPERARGDRSRPPRARGGRGRPRQPAEDRAGTACAILFDRREGEPDLTGTTAVFEGYFDPETGDRRRAGDGVPRLRAGNERIWGYECWWRFDPTGAGVTPEDHEEIEAAKKLLRGLLRDARRAGRVRAT